MPLKGDEVMRAIGKHRADFTPDELARYGAYCCNDTLICAQLFAVFAPMLPGNELFWQDAALRMAVDPRLQLDQAVLEADLVRVQKRKAELLDALQTHLGLQSREQLQAALGSNTRFTGLLEDCGGVLPFRLFGSPGLAPHEDAAGVKRYRQYLDDRQRRTNGTDGLFPIPVKPSPTHPEKYVHAFAKTDEGMQELAEDCDERVRALVAARLGVKSTIEETRVEKLIRLAPLGALSVPVRVSGAHTHRLGGDDGINLQNLPSGRVEGQSKAMRLAIVAREGYQLIAGDSAQIEARTLAYMAQQRDLLAVFQAGGDPYSMMAARIYKGEPDDIRQGALAGDANFILQRQLGKATELGAGFKMGANRFRVTARGQYRLHIDDETARHAISTYRATHEAIVRFWERCGDVIALMLHGNKGWFGGPSNELFYYEGNRELFGVHTPGVRLPDGMWLNYPNLRVDDVTGEFIYDQRKGKATAKTRLYDGKLTENLTQALAFALMKWQAFRIRLRYPLLLNEHDCWVTMAVDGEVDDALRYVGQCMSEVPEWAQGLPVACEIGAAHSFGEC
jgi:hypothetical protein